VVVDTNRIVGSDTTGILVTNYSRVRARSNVIDSTRAVGVLVDRSATPSQGDTLAVLFANNNITRNAKHGVYNYDGAAGGLIDARSNWWGDPLGPRCAVVLEQCSGASVGDSVSQGVVWNPALGAPVTTVLPPAPPAFATFTPPAFRAEPAGRAATQRERPAARPAADAPDLPEVFTPRPRAEGDGVSGLLMTADRERAERSAVRVEQLRARQALRAEEARRRAEQEAARAARRAQRAEEGRP
jgi:hypothetical protein